MVGVVMCTIGAIGAAVLIGGVIRLVDWVRERWDEAATAVGL